ncbi:hypothetical protein BGZ60DRAFT_429975 [Tricladium varicosporioides]|nr:hypothetical protein BGZ60DRAFT_429975 [Hymenoscyphus varicosporioides]
MSHRHQTNRSDPHPTVSGLVKAAFQTGRERGASATPAPSVISPAPNRGLQFPRHLQNMNSGPPSHSSFSGTLMNTQSHSSFGGGAPTNTSPQSNQSRPSQSDSGHNRDSSTSTHHSTQSHEQIASPSSLRSHSGSQSQVVVDYAEMSVSQLSAYLQDRLTQLQTRIKRTPGIASNVQDSLIEELRSISQEYNEKQRQLQRQIDHIQTEKARLLKQLNEVEQKLRTTTDERDSLQARIDALVREAEKSDKEWQTAMETVQATNTSLLEKLALQEEQLKGKRALWLESNPGSSARRDAMKAAIRDPFHSPSTNYSTSNTGSQMGGGYSPLQSPLKSSFGGPPPQIGLQAPPNGPAIPRGPRRRPAALNLPIGKAPPGVPAPSFDTWGQYSSNRPPITTEPGDDIRTPIAVSASTALVIRDQKDRESPEDYEEGFAKMYTLCEGWVKTYSSTPNLANDQKIARSNDTLWSFMMNCTYPGHRQDSHTHVCALLNDPTCRKWFVMRMCVTYCVMDIINLENFYDFSPLVRTTLEDVRRKLLQRGLNNEARQELIDTQARACQSVLSSTSYQAYRANQLNNHTKRLRDILGPLLNDNVSLQAAGRDLGSIVVCAWELNCKMHCSHLTFQVYFPETASKFTAATMVAKDRPSTDPMQLQIRQTRLKLVITPVITMRDDRGTTIKAKNLHHSTVLTML